MAGIEAINRRMNPRRVYELANPMTSPAQQFLSAYASNLAEDERLILCGFLGDPGRAEPRDWRPRPWRPGVDIPFGPRANGYVTVSSFARAPDNTFRRRAATFAAGRALMVDDVRTKVDPAIVAHVLPSAIVETSLGNEQWWYFLSEPCADAEVFDGVIRAFISGKLLGVDPGMGGITRVGRLPGFTNGKPQHCGFITRLLALEDRRYTIQELLDAFRLAVTGRTRPPPLVPKDVALTRVRAFEVVYKWLKKNGMLKKHDPDQGGWTEMHCPWVQDHTDSADNGAAIREPMAENQYFGAFRCHHGHCQGRGWKHLTEWIVTENVAEELEKRNREAVATFRAQCPHSRWV